MWPPIPSFERLSPSDTLVNFPEGEVKVRLT